MRRAILTMVAVLTMVGASLPAERSAEAIGSDWVGMQAGMDCYGVGRSDIYSDYSAAGRSVADTCYALVYLASSMYYFDPSGSGQCSGTWTYALRYCVSYPADRKTWAIYSDHNMYYSWYNGYVSTAVE
jgi:hypothetical protein